MLKYQRILLHEQVNTVVGTALLASVALWACMIMWHVATGENLVVNAFAAIVDKETTLR